MKRATVSFLILSIIALPAFANSSNVRTVAVKSARCVSLEHIAGGWRMEIQCDQSKGAILLLDAGRHAQYLGEGVFQGWSQSDLMSLYQSLIPKIDSHFEVMQLG